jgi:hypothetical protein
MLTTITALVLCNNINWTYSPRCNAPVAEFHRTIDGWEGTLTNGIPFTQEIITPNIHEFKMEDMHWFVINGEIVYINK